MKILLLLPAIAVVVGFALLVWVVRFPLAVLNLVLKRLETRLNTELEHLFDALKAELY